MAKKSKAIQNINNIIEKCETSIEENWSGDADYILINRLEEIINDLKVLKKTIKN